MNKFLFVSLFCAMVAQGAALPSVDNIAALRVRGQLSSNEAVIVRGYTTPGDWGGERIAIYVPNATATATNSGCEFASSINPNNH